jgi:hypothetical protein
VKILGVVMAALAIVGGTAAALYYSQPQASSQPGYQVLPASFANATNLTNNKQDSVYGQVAAWQDSVYVVWQDSVSFEQRNYDIFIKKSGDRGDSFGQTLNLSNNSGFSEHPQLSAYQNSVYVVWADDTSGNREVQFAKSADNGTSFGPVTNLSSNPSDSFNQEVAAFENYVYVVWLDEGDSSRILFRASSDGGNSFGETIAVSDKANGETFPKVAADKDGVYVAWNLLSDEGEDGLFYAKSSDHGATFEDVVKLNREENFGESQVAANDGSVYIVSGGLDSAEVNNLLLANSSDGRAFDVAEVDGNGTFVNPLNVELVAANGTLYVTGQVFYSGSEEILLLTLDGSEPASVVNLSSNKGISECPSIAMAGGNIYVVWEDLTPGNHEVLFAKGKVREMGFEPTNP